MKVIGAGSAAAVLAVSGVGKLVEAMPIGTKDQTNPGSANTMSNSSNSSGTSLNPSEPLVVIISDGEILGFQGTNQLIVKNPNLAKKLFSVFGGEN